MDKINCCKTKELTEEEKRQEELDNEFADYRELYAFLRQEICYLHASYEHYFERFGIQKEVIIFDDFKLLSNIYEKRTKNSFMFIA